MRYLAIIISLLWVCGIAAAQNEAYERGEYATAIAQYEALIENGVRNGAIYYNLGAAYDENGEVGRALLNYRRAAQFIPRDEQLNNHLARLRAQRRLPASDETNPFILLGTLTNSVMTFSELALLTLIVWSAFFLCGAFVLLRRSWRFTLRGVLWVMGLATLCGAVLLGARWFITTQQPPAVLIANVAPVLSGPGGDYLRLFEVYDASECHILEKRGDWARISLPNGQQGWVNQDSLAQVSG